MNKKILIILLAMFFLVVIFASSVDAFCCEKVKGGAYCMNVADESACDQTGSLRTSPTACESTTYCSLGTVIDSEEGNCFESTQAISDAKNGYWDPRDRSDIPACQIGCCIVGDQAAFVTQARCNTFSEFYGAANTFRRDVTDELQCIALAEPEAKGACVTEPDTGRTCTMETKQNCQEASGEFHVGYLCTAFDLNTNCAKTRKTICVEGRDEVFYIDSCDNLANIYDSTKYDSGDYWTYIVEWEESCGAGESNSNSKSCGNCDYLLGSTCGLATGDDKRPNHGVNICKDLSCKYEGEKYLHGESWCVTNAKKSEYKNSPGSEYFKLVCYNGEVIPYNGDPFRQSICVEEDIEGFRFAGFDINKWQPCVEINNSEDCLDKEFGDCKWIEKIKVNLPRELRGYEFSKYFRENDVSIGDGFTFGDLYPPKKGDDGEYQEGVCVPKYAPGFNNYEENEFNAPGICGAVSTVCVVEFEKGIKEEWFEKGRWKCIKNCECLSEKWEEKLDQMCVAMGDCGIKVNYLGIEGYDEDGEPITSGGPQCGDGIDNDGDGKTDYPEDSTCTSLAYYSESNSIDNQEALEEAYDVQPEEEPEENEEEQV